MEQEDKNSSENCWGSYVQSFNRDKQTIASFLGAKHVLSQKGLRRLMCA